ncbi:hypothetical protein LDENG_00116430 [Lucifuga dentata]|nr:hypothetical protein LDENG_00116430 [Lucifuga dentata]
MLLSLGMLMLSATQIYTIFTVQLFAFLNLLPVEADIAAYSFDNKTENFEDLPARFGYRLPGNGLKGFLIGARPENACEPIEPPPRDNLTGAFIILIKRFDCNFDIKEKKSQEKPSTTACCSWSQIRREEKERKEAKRERGGDEE